MTHTLTIQHYLKFSIIRYWFCIILVCIIVSHKKIALEKERNQLYSMCCIWILFIFLSAYFSDLILLCLIQIIEIILYLIIIRFLISLHHFSLFNKMASIAYTLCSCSQFIFIYHCFFCNLIYIFSFLHRFIIIAL